jgi:PhzF family phenazine biosynthesis protein
MRKSNKNRIPIYQVDAFTSELFRGNPAAVCFLRYPREDNILQSIAAERNLSETAFLRNLEEKPFKDARLFSLRWFTPETEVPLCGHATLATAAVLFYDVNISATEVSFETRSGTLTAKREDDGILLNFPSHDVTPIDPDQNLLSAVGISYWKSVQFSRKTRALLIHLQDEEILMNLKPDFGRMKSIRTKERIEGVIVTSKGHAPYDFVSRFFAPWVGIDEDPVTGAAHTILGPYWSKILGKKEMLAYQASARGGELIAKVLSKDRVGLVGNAVIVSKGELYLQQRYGHTDEE